jgi:hypothetical protein
VVGSRRDGGVSERQILRRNLVIGASERRQQTSKVNIDIREIVHTH